MRRVYLMSIEDVKYLVLHCSGTRCNENYTPEMLRRDHRAMNLRDVGYHFYVRRDGTKTQHRMPLEAGAHCTYYNKCSIGICYEGGLDENGFPCNTMTVRQKRTLIGLLCILHKMFPQAKIVGHRDLPGNTSKDCPCLDTRKEFGWICENYERG